QKTPDDLRGPDHLVGSPVNLSAAASIRSRGQTGWQSSRKLESKSRGRNYQCLLALCLATFELARLASFPTRAGVRWLKAKLGKLACWTSPDGRTTRSHGCQGSRAIGCPVSRVLRGPIMMRQEKRKKEKVGAIRVVT